MFKRKIYNSGGFELGSYGAEGEQAGHFTTSTFHWNILLLCFALNFFQVSELNSKINELEEEALIESGRARCNSSEMFTFVNYKYTHL